MSLSYIF